MKNFSNMVSPSLRVCILALIIGAVVAFTYLLFEWLVRTAQHALWIDFMQTNEYRWRIIPLVLGLTLLYFWVQHRLDPASEHAKRHTLTQLPKVSLRNLANGLVIGFLSLVAGASLGPEAILVPASMMISMLLASRFIKTKNPLTQYAAALGFIALLAAFFNSFIVGMLGLLLVKKQFKLPLNMQFVLAAIFAALIVVVVLNLLGSNGYIPLGSEWSLSLATPVWLVAIFLVGLVLPFALKCIVAAFENVLKIVHFRHWSLRALLAGLVLSILYIVGGPLVQFTGNESIQPLLQQSATLGLGGLFLILLVKLAAIAWSKTSGYRGGLIFPMFFVLSVVVAGMQLYSDAVPFTAAVVVGALALLIGDAKAKVLFD